MNILFFLTPKNDVAFIYSDANLREDMELISVMEVKRRQDNSPVNAGAKMEDLLDKAMQQNFVPVLDDNKSFIGIITRRDIMKYFSGSYKKTGNA